MYNTSCAEIYYWLTKEKLWHWMLKSLRPYLAFESEEWVKRQRVQYTPILDSSAIMQKI